MNHDVWYHGSDIQYSEIQPSQHLKLDYPTENGLWLTNDIYDAYMYGKYVTKYNVVVHQYELSDYMEGLQNLLWKPFSDCQ